MSVVQTRIVSEAAWVITNAITKCSDKTLREFVAKYYCIIVEPLANALNLVAYDKPELLMNILESWEKLFALDFAETPLSTEDGSLRFIFE